MRHSVRAGMPGSEVSIRPNFIIPGAAKSGTTFLTRVLDTHPDVYMAYPKEPHFFVTEKPYGDTVRTWEEYLDLFRGAQICRAVGEASTAYIYHWDEAPERIAEFIPNCKILVLVRNPIDRVYSMYWQNVRDAREPLSLEEALDAEPMRVRHRWEVSYHYTSIGFVAPGVRRFQRFFGLDNVKVVLFEDLFGNLDQSLTEISGFLGIADTGYRVPRARVNSSGEPRWRYLQQIMNEPGPVKEVLMRFTPRRARRQMRERISAWNLRPAPTMPAPIRRELVQLFDDEITAIESITGRSLEHWRRVA